MIYTVTNVRYYDATYGAPADESLRVEVETFDELRQVEWMRRVESLPEFYRWSYDRHELTTSEGKGIEGQRIVDCNLMAEFKGGAEWWVVAKLPDGCTFGLPKREPKGGP